jgi:hypothetical protein
VNTECVSPPSKSILEYLVPPGPAAAEGFQIGLRAQGVTVRLVPGFQHLQAQLLQSGRQINDYGFGLVLYDGSGLVAEPGFQMSYERAVQEGKQAEIGFRSDWTEADVDY